MGPAALPGKADRPLYAGGRGETVPCEMGADRSEFEPTGRTAVDDHPAGRVPATPSDGAPATPSDAAAPTPVPGGIEPPRSRRRGIVVATVVIAVALGVIWAAAKVMGGVGLPADPTGLRAPDFTMPVLGGDGARGLADLRGKPVVLNFWASWCGPCRKEAPVLAAAERQWSSRGVVFLGVDSEDTTSAALAFDREFGLAYESVFDPEGRLELRYGVSGFPETFFIGPDGVIRAKYVGPIDRASLDAYVSAMLPKAG
jgi:DsbE subfamily thiol:disulfide oxidoreductase